MRNLSLVLIKHSQPARRPSARMTTEDGLPSTLYPTHCLASPPPALRYYPLSHLTPRSYVDAVLADHASRSPVAAWFPGSASPSLHGTSAHDSRPPSLPFLHALPTPLSKLYLSGARETHLSLRLFRYFRLIVNCISHWTFRPIPIPDSPTYSSQDVTIILPTIATGGDELETTLRTCLSAETYELILVTIDANVDNLTNLANKINAKKIRVLSIREANKRRQMCRAIPEVSTRITVFVDDDVMWPPKVLQWMLAPFEDPKTGGVGTSQRLRRSKNMSVWSFLGAAYLERRNFDCSACLHIDGGLPCLSGRTVAYRTGILQDAAFTHGFTHEEWRTCQLNADDDNFITRWLYSHGWKIAMQYHKEAEVQTTLEDSPKYLSQCLRWVRSNWRSNLTSMFVERHYWWYVIERGNPYMCGTGQLTNVTGRSRGAHTPSSRRPSQPGHGLMIF